MMGVNIAMTNQFKIEWAASPNFKPGRNGRKPIAIVDHITAGLMPGCLSWMRNPKSKASAHYLVCRDGRIFQMVKDEDTAYHAGAVNKPNWPLYNGTNPNYYTIGIEHEGQPFEPLTDAQYQATLWLHKMLCAKWGIPITNNSIIGHYRIDSVNRPNCPGPKFPWTRLFNDLKGVDTVAQIPDWMINGGRDGLKTLQDKGLIMGADTWGKAEELEKPIPAGLFWMIMGRLADYKGGK